LRYEQVRSKPKDFRFRRPGENGEWIWNLKGVAKIPYRLPEVIAADEVFIAEGEKDVESLRKYGLVATCNPGGAGKWVDDYSKFLKGKKVCILQDDDEPGRKHALAVAKSVARYASETKLLPPFADAKDFTEWAERAGNKKKLLEIAAKTAPFQFSDATTDSDSDPEGIARTGDWRDECLRGGLLVSMHEAIYRDYLIFPSTGLPLVVALWGIGTHMFNAFDTYPYLIVSSPAKKCGKTRLAELLEMLSAKGFMNVNISEAALFRKIARDKPTLILDEAEALDSKSSERSTYLLSILQAGFRKGGRVTRCAGPDHDLEEFDVFCPKVVAAIGHLPDTLRDRGIVIPMRRKLKSEPTKRYRLRKVAGLAEGPASAAAVWAAKHRQAVEQTYLKLDLDFLQDREADIWEPIFAIASIAVPNRLGELKRIALSLSAEKLQLDVDDSLGIRLLADIRAVCDCRAVCGLSRSNLINCGSMMRMFEVTRMKISKLVSRRIFPRRNTRDARRQEITDDSADFQVARAANPSGRD
jgi:hypothetical protein